MFQVFAPRRNPWTSEQAEAFRNRRRNQTFDPCNRTRSAWITLVAQGRALCLKCADLDYLVKALEEAEVRAAVVAHVRHTDTDYDRLLARGHDRREARTVVAATVDQVLTLWQGSGAQSFAKQTPRRSRSG